MLMGTAAGAAVTDHAAGQQDRHRGRLQRLSSRGVAIHGDQVAAYTDAGAASRCRPATSASCCPRRRCAAACAAPSGYQVRHRLEHGETVAAFRFEIQPRPAGPSRADQPAGGLPDRHLRRGHAADGARRRRGAAGQGQRHRRHRPGRQGRRRRLAAGGHRQSSAGAAVTTRWAASRSSSATASPSLAARASSTPGSGTTPHWRPAVVKTATGQGWLVVAGGSARRRHPGHHLGQDAGADGRPRTRWASTTTRRPSCTGRA